MKEIIEKLKEKNLKISTMESCTGGLLASSITDVPNSSEVFSFGAVTYSNEAKIRLGVSKESIEKYSVYSPEVATEMSEAIIKFTGSDIGVGITGKLKKADEENPEGKDNEVFVSVINKTNNKILNKKIIVTKPSRHENKLDIVKEVEVLINEIL